MITNNLLPPIQAAKRLILDFSRKLVPERILGAMNIILSPCCDVSITDVSFVCTGTNVASITFSLNKKIFFPGTIGYSVRSNVDLAITNSGLVANGSDTVTIDGVTITPGTATYTLTIYYSSSSEFPKGAFELAMATVTNPTCV